MNKGLAAAVVGLVFVTGIGVGALGILAVQHFRPHHPPPILVQSVLERRLDLTPDQTQQMRHLTNEHREKMAEIRPRVQSEIERLRAEHIAAVHAILDEEQRREFDLIRERHERRERRLRHPRRGERRSRRPEGGGFEDGA